MLKKDVHIGMPILAKVNRKLVECVVLSCHMKEGFRKSQTLFVVQRVSDGKRFERSAGRLRPTSEGVLIQTDAALGAREMAKLRKKSAR